MKRRGFRMAGVSGATILELTVALALMSVLFSIVYTCWRMIDNYTFTQARRTELQAECGRLSEMIANEVRRSGAVIKWDEASIDFIPSEGTDTITYDFNGSEFERNDRPVSLAVPRTKIAGFSIENQNDDEPSSPFLFRFTITLVNNRGESATTSQTVMAHRINEQRPDSDFMW